MTPSYQKLKDSVIVARDVFESIVAMADTRNDTEGFKALAQRAKETLDKCLKGEDDGIQTAKVRRRGI
jgi:hypothetical protein